FIMRRQRICAVACVTPSLQSPQFGGTAHNNRVLGGWLQVQGCFLGVLRTTQGKRTIQEGCCSVARTKSIGAAHSGRSRSVLSQVEFAECDSTIRRLNA